MGFTLTVAPKKRIKIPRTPRQKTASGDFFQNPNESRLENRPQPLRAQQGTAPYSYKIVSGRPVWPSRDPIAEKGGINLYGFVKNDGINQFDRFGLAPGDVAPNTCSTPSGCVVHKTNTLPNRYQWEEDVNWEAWGPWHHQVSVGIEIGDSEVDESYIAGAKLWQRGRQETTDRYFVTYSRKQFVYRKKIFGMWCPCGWCTENTVVSRTLEDSTITDTETQTFLVIGSTDRPPADFEDESPWPFGDWKF